MTIKTVFDQAKSLHPIDKVKLVDLILSDLDQPDGDVEKLWIKEVLKRKERLRSGKTKALSYQQVMGQYK